MKRIWRKGIAVFLMALMVISACTGCDKVSTVNRGVESYTDFYINEALRFGDMKVDVEVFILYAIDSIPTFENEYGPAVWNKESVNMEWVEADPQSAAILYTSDIILSCLSCSRYYMAKYGEISADIEEQCKAAAKERYEEAKAAAGEYTVSEEAILEYTREMYMTSRIYSEISNEFDGDTESVKGAILGLRDAIDEDFDYDKQVNWKLLRQIDFSRESSYEEWEQQIEE